MRDVTDRGPLFAQAIKSKVEAFAYRAHDLGCGNQVAITAVFRLGVCQVAQT